MTEASRNQPAAETFKLAAEQFFAGLKALGGDDLAAAEAHLRKALELVPDRPSTLVNLSIVYARQDRLAEALASVDKALAQGAADSLTWNQKGAVHLKLAQHEQALACFDHALALDPRLHEAHNNRGSALRGLNRLEDALASYDQAIILKLDYAEALCNRGAALNDLNRLDDALESFDRAIMLKPDHAEAHNNRGVALRELGRLDEALLSYDRAIHLRPRYAEAFNNRGGALKELKRLDQALASYDKAISLKPDYAEAHGNRGNALADLRRLEEAMASFDAAISLKPDYAEAYSNRGVTLKEMKRYDEALQSYDMAIGLKPDYAEAYNNKAQLLLKLQDLRNGFRLYGWRWQARELGGKRLDTTISPWNGEPLTRNLLLWAEQGIGDEILYSSMIPLLDPRTGVTLSADKRLHSIFQRSFPGLKLIDRVLQKQPVNSGYDAQAPMGDLGRLLNVSPDMIAKRRSPFLIPSDERTRDLLDGHDFLRARPVCGLAWKSANKRIGDEKSIALRDLEPLLTTAGITFVNLQYGDVDSEIDDAARDLGTIVHQARDVDVFNDIDGLLSLIAACDIVLTTSNVTAHLAGAIGKKAAVLVPTGKGRIWYWHDQPESLWYPSLRLFSQAEDWNWEPAISAATHWVRENISWTK